jgi:hypothetical protein
MATNRALKTLLLLVAASSAVADYEIQKPILEQGSERPTAKLILYPGSRVHLEDLKSLHEEVRPCPEDSQSVETGLELDTCLSGEYYLQDNFRIASLPSCDDGTAPILSFYRRRGCNGEPSLTRQGLSLANACLWSKEDELNP